MKKCILSLTLVLCMLVSILPATSLVSAADSAVKYTYDFTTNAIASTYDIATLNSEVAAAKNDYTVKYTVLNAFAATPTVDTAKTTGWSVANTRYVCNATENGGTYSELTADGFRFLLFTGRYFDEAAKNSYFGTASWKAGMCTHVAFVINIPVAGIYDLNMFNNVAHTYGAHTEVRFGKAEKTTLGDGDVTNLYNAADTVVLGWHDSSTVHDGSASNPAETFTIMASEPGNYFIIFATPNGTLEKNSNRISSTDAEVTTGGGFQTLNLSKITLTPVAGYTYDFTTNAIASTYDIAKLNSEVAEAKTDSSAKYTVLNAFAATPTVDTAKTTGWSVANTRYVFNATTGGETYSELTSDGFRFLLFTGRYFDEDADNNYIQNPQNWTAGMCTHVAFVINIPVAGTYDLNMFNNVAHTYGAHTEVRFGKTTKTTLGNGDVTDLYNAADAVVLGWHDSSTVHDGSASNPAETFTITASKPGYYFIIFATPNGTLEKNLNRISLADAEVTTGGGVQTLNLSKITLTVPIVEPEEDEALSDAFEITEKTEENYSEPSVITVSVNNADINSVKNSNGTHTITAPETNGEGKNFLYWAKGLTAQKKIISFSNVLSDYVPDAKYANYLIAVYEGEESQSAEYYNANGQLIGTKTEPDLPSMAGYGEAKEWKQYGKTNIHVAQYELAAPPKDIAITVNNGTGTGTYAYGDTVTCRADGSGTFKCWTKSGINGNTEIVSCDETYIFKAWEECTVTAVYEDYNYTGNTAKIIIDSFIAGAETGVMAEFVGFDSAVEKGIMFTDSDKNTMRIAMTTKDNQFTVIADESGTYNGYAILKEENGSYTLITDGSYEHTK